ncbi:hypothetical protein Y032_0014g2460 [Ancylostoma ceylanicum]|uniref:Uncharacterized protein n=1 Tax=Ancylostoma ceylanicum TaxID=53326 RepID=A0A016V9K4_9BILA|nr:hypothetical protein Y032_0014g2460 [Ancylostoma ceylanicum]
MERVNMNGDDWSNSFMAPHLYSLQLGFDHLVSESQMPISAVAGKLKLRRSGMFVFEIVTKCEDANAINHIRFFSLVVSEFKRMEAELVIVKPGMEFYH